MSLTAWAASPAGPPVVVDHVDFAPHNDRGHVFLDGDDALVLDGNSPVFLRWANGHWSVAQTSTRAAPPLRPGAWYGALAHGRALLAGNNAAFAVNLREGTWAFEEVLVLPEKHKSTHGVALSPTGRHGLILYDLKLAALERTAQGGWSATPVDLSGKVRGAVLDDNRAVVLTADSALVLERERGRWVQRGALELVPDQPLSGTDNGLIPNGAVAIDGRTVAIALVTRRWPSPQVHVFDSTPAGWKRTAILKPPANPSGPPPQFGEALDLRGGRLLIGSPAARAARRCGNVYLYSRPGPSTSEWTLHHLVDPSACTSHGFGAAVALDSKRALIFAPEKGAVYMDGRNHPGRPRRLYSYSFSPPGRPPFAALGVPADGPGDWVGHLEGERRLDGRRERVRLGVMLRISRGLAGVTLVACDDGECSGPVPVGYLAEPADRIDLNSPDLARRFLGAPTPSGVARGALTLVGERLVADLVIDTGTPDAPRAKLELSRRERGADVDAQVRQTDVVILERAPAETYAGDWLGSVTDGPAQVPLLLRLEVVEGRLGGEVCTTATRCARLQGIEEQLDQIALEFPRTPRGGDWHQERVAVTFRREADTLRGTIGGAQVTLYPLGERSPAAFFEQIQRQNQHRRQPPPPPRDCVCACYCGAAQPSNACPWDQCGCKPCPPGIP